MITLILSEHLDLVSNKKHSKFHYKRTIALCVMTEMTKIRKTHEDNWIRRLATQFPYSMNDRIDSLEYKDLYNCEYAKFISEKDSTRRISWANKESGDARVKLKSDEYMSNVIDKLMDIIKQK